MKKKFLIIIATVLILLAVGAIVFYDDLISIIQYGRVCLPNPLKGKVAVIIVKDGIYDNEKISSHVSEYFDSVKKDLGIEAAGLKKFDGTTMDDLDMFVDGLYTKDDVGYIILLGDDFPANYTSDSFENDNIFYLANSKLECANGDCNMAWPPGCKDIAISFILPPLIYPPNTDSATLKTDFVVKVLEIYTGYHNNFDAIISRYQRSLLYIRDPTRLVGSDYLRQDPKTRINLSVAYEMQKLGYDMPAVFILNNESGRIWEEAKKKHMVLYANVHGQTGVLGLGLGNETLESVGRIFSSENHPYNATDEDLHNMLKSYNTYTTLDRWLNFSKEYGLPALFVDSDACERTTLEDENIGQTAYHCCWPQIFMESGVWAYFTAYYNGDVIGVQKRFSDEKTIGLAVRRSWMQYSFIFGDILAHMK
jgi:hypothetical protein